jgi:hypothetical protein
LSSIDHVVAAFLAAIIVVPLAATAARESVRDLALIDVPPGGDLQGALDRAQPGDTIRLSAGATYTGGFTLPAKSGAGEIVVRTDTLDSNLPPTGTRIRTSDASRLARVEAAAGSVFTAAPGAQHYRFLELEIAPSAGTFLYNVVTLGDGSEATVAEQPNDITFDRCYIHGDPVAGSRRGIAMNGRNLTVVDSRLSDFKEVGADSQAVASWNGAGPFTIVNNYLEGAGENVIFGGADPRVPGLVPADIVVRHNHFFKPLTWKADDPSYAGTHWSVKNLFELKNARRVLVEGNVFEQNWADAQNGFSILFTVRNQDGTAPWSQVDHVTFRNNVVRHVGAGFNLLGYDNNFPSRQTDRIGVSNNLLYDLTDSVWKGNGAFLQVLDATANVTADHNTVFHTGNVITADGRAHTGFVFTNNIAAHNSYGVIGTNHGPGNDSLDVYFPGRTFLRNAIPGASNSYPIGNFYPANMSDLRFVDRAGGIFRLADSSPYKNAGTDGKDIGADIDVVDAATCGAVNGTYCQAPGGPPVGPPLVPFLWIGALVAVVMALTVLGAVMRRRRRRRVLRFSRGSGEEPQVGPRPDDTSAAIPSTGIGKFSIRCLSSYSNS